MLSRRPIYRDTFWLFQNQDINTCFIFPRTPSPQSGYRGQESQQSWRGPESLPRTPLPPAHGPQGPAGLPYYNAYPPQIEGEYRTLMLSPSSARTDDTFDESIGSQVSTEKVLYVGSWWLCNKDPRLYARVTLVRTKIFYVNEYIVIVLSR